VRTITMFGRSFVATFAVLELCSLVAAVALPGEVDGDDEVCAFQPQGRGFLRRGLRGGSMDFGSDASQPISVESNAAPKTGSSATSAILMEDDVLSKGFLAAAWRLATGSIATTAILMEDAASSNVFLAAGARAAQGASSATLLLLSLTACCCNCCCLGLIYWLMKKMMNGIMEKKKEWDSNGDENLNQDYV